MHGSRRRYLFAIIVGLIVLLIGGSYTYNEFDKAARQRQANYDYQPAQNARLPNVTAQQSAPQEYQPNCKRPNNRDDADLCAQWGAVQQTTEANRLASLNLRLTLATFFATMFGTALLVWTLWETRATARRQLRAYVFVGEGDEPYPKPITRDSRLQFQIKNTGLTPAFDVRLSRAAIFLKRPIRGILVELPGVAENIRTIPPSGIIKFFIDLDELSEEDFLRFDDGSVVLIWRVRVDYRTVFGRHDFDDRTLFFSGEEMDEGSIGWVGDQERQRT